MMSAVRPTRSAIGSITACAVLSIPADAINYNRARDLEPEPGAAESHTGVAGYGILFESRPLVIFGLCVMLFHLANAALAAIGGTEAGTAMPASTAKTGTRRRTARCEDRTRH
jgi:hypothetical protein